MVQKPALPEGVPRLARSPGLPRSAMAGSCLIGNTIGHGRRWGVSPMSQDAADLDAVLQTAVDRGSRLALHGPGPGYRVSMAPTRDRARDHLQRPFRHRVCLEDCAEEAPLMGTRTALRGQPRDDRQADRQRDAGAPSTPGQRNALSPDACQTSAMRTTSPVTLDIAVAVTMRHPGTRHVTPNLQLLRAGQGARAGTPALAPPDASISR